MALKNREDTTLRFLNLVNDSIVTDQDFPQVVITDLGKRREAASLQPSRGP